MGVSAANAKSEQVFLDSVRNFLEALAKALAAFQFYGASNPAALRALATARTSCQAIWEHDSEVELMVRENGIDLGKASVYHDDSRSRSLAFLLYKDGVRALKLLKGFESEDLDELLLVLHKAKHLRSEEDDLITLLWAADFSRLFYSYVDLGEGEEPQFEPRTNEPESFSRAVALGNLSSSADDDAVGTAVHEGSADPPALPETVVQDNTEVLLEPEDIEYLERELVRERTRDVCRDVIHALLDRLEDSEPKIQSEILLILEDLIPSLILQRRLDIAATTLRAVREIGEECPSMPESQKHELQDMLQSVGSSSAIEGVLQALESGDLVTDDAILDELFAHLGAGSLESLIRMREKTTRNSFWKTLDKAISAASQRSPDTLLALCRSADSIVACAAIRLVGQTDRFAVETQLAPMIRSQSIHVRAAVVDVMVLHGSKTLLQRLLECLDDEDRDVRCAAAWGLGTWEYPPALAKLEAILASQEFRQAGMNEMRAIFSAYARIGKDKALRLLKNTLNKKSLFGRREPSEMRVCAARALGVLESPEAEAELNKAKDDKDPLVRRAVRRSLLAGRK